VNALAEWDGLKSRVPPKFDWRGKRLKIDY